MRCSGSSGPPASIISRGTHDRAGQGMSRNGGTVKLPRGFRFAGVAAGIRPSKPDVALFVSDHDAACAGVFTVNRAKAAPVVDAERRLPSDRMRAIVVTSGNANALSGAAGAEAVEAILAATARALGVDRTQVASAATGVIGMRLPHDK